MSVLEAVKESASPFIGKDFEVSDPQQNGKALRLGDKGYDEQISQFKLYQESQVQLGTHIMNAGQIAIGYFKQRSILMKGPTG